MRKTQVSVNGTLEMVSDNLLTGDAFYYNSDMSVDTVKEAERTEIGKWGEYEIYCNTLTVQRPEELPIALGFKFSADQQSLVNISLEIDTMLDADTRVWYEDWGSQSVTKQDLQEAKRLASEAKQAKLLELFGA